MHLEAGDRAPGPKYFYLDNDLRKTFKMSVKSAPLMLAVVSGVGLLAMAAPTLAQSRPVQHRGPVSFTGPTFVRAPRGFATVEAALSQFDYALAMHDVGMLQSAGVDRASARLWDRFFSENPLATVTDNCPVTDLLTSEDNAIWTCTETVTIISAGRPRTFEHLIRFTFSRSNGIWKVSNRR